MAKMNYGKRILALVLALVMCFGAIGISAHAAAYERSNWTYAYYLGQEYLGNKAGAAVKPDPVGYGFQGVITSLTFADDEGTSWTFNWNYQDNGEWRITGNNVTKTKASDWPVITQDKEYIGYCGNKAYRFTLTDDGKAAGWTYVNDSARHVNWFYYIRFIREYTVNVFYQNETGSVVYNGIRYAAQAPLTADFTFYYPNGNIIDDSEYKDGEYTDPTTLWPADYLPQAMKDQGYELKYATDANGKDVMQTGVTISLLGENVLNVYCTLIPPKTEDYTVVHKYYTEDSFDGSQPGGSIEVLEDADFAQVVAGIRKLPAFGGNTYGYIRYSVDPARKVIELIYTRALPTYNYALTYNANFGENETKADEENVEGVTALTYGIGVNGSEFVRENYSFIGWNTQADGKGTAYAAGDTVALSAENNTEILYAQWQENPKYTFALIYNANFGENPETKADAENVSGTYVDTHSIEVDGNSFVRANHTFIGWNTQADGKGVAYGAGEKIALDAQNNIAVLYAQWQEHPKYDYSLIYNANFGVNQTKADAQNVSGTYATSYAIEVDGNSFIRENHTFIGWNTQADGKGTAYAAGEIVALTAQNNTEILYAQWQEHPKFDYEVIYNANFGANETKADEENISGTYATSHAIEVNENSFRRANYTFIGWNTQANGKGTAYAAGETVALTAEENTAILYAQWQENPKYDYEVKYNANFGLFPATAADEENIFDTYATSHTIEVNENPFERANHTFIGWSEARRGEVVFAAGDQILFTEGGEKTLYAQWIEHDKYAYTVIYNGNGGETAEGEVSYGDSENVASTYATSHRIAVDENGFVRENYTFTGWNTQADGKGTAYSAEDVIALTAQENTLTLYAQWQENPKYDYAVTYNANFGEEPETAEDAENISGIYDAAYQIEADANRFEQEGYTFIGWNTQADGKGTAYSAEDVIALTAQENTLTLYAQWRINEYEFYVRYMVRIDDGAYNPFAGQLPEDAPVGGKALFGTVLDETTLAGIPAALTDSSYTYGFTALEGVQIPFGSNTVTVYYTYVSPEEPVVPPTEPEEPVVPPTEPVVTPEEPVVPPTEPVVPPVEPPVVEIPDEPVPQAPAPVVTPEAPVVEIPDEPVPQAPAPAPNNSGLVELPDEDVPLASVPKTGDPIIVYAAMCTLSGLGLLGLNLKKKEEEEA